MKKTIYSLKSISALLLIIAISVSCDNDFSNIESDIQGIKNFNATGALFPMEAKTKLFTPYTSSGNSDVVGVQTNNTPGTLLGVYKDPNAVFGVTEASVTTQLIPTNFNPDFGENPVLESVIINIPYYSSVEDTDEDGLSTYTLDSIFGNQDVEYKLSIYRNNYTLRDLNPDADFETAQCYYSNQQALFDDTTSTLDLIYEDTAFKPNAEQIVIPGEIDPETEEQADDTLLIPSIRIDLTDAVDTNVKLPTFFSDLLFVNATPDDLSNQNLFKNYFRGLVFKVEALTADGSMFYINMSAGSVIVDYTNDEEIADAEDYDDSIATTYTLQFTGNTVNTFTTVNNNINVDGDEQNLYLKGGDGAFAVLDLFAGADLDGNGLSDIEDDFRSKKDQWLINEANLVFYVNQDLVNGDEPNRLTLYDLKNNIPIIDHFLDASINSTDPNTSLILYSEILERDDDDKGVRYKLRITNHINNILQQDSTNVKLGLYLTHNINNITESKIQGINRDNDDATIDVLPASTILSPKGTILYGSDTTTIPVGKVAEFEIFYTDPEN